MKVWKFSLCGLTALAGLTPGSYAQAPGVPVAPAVAPAPVPVAAAPAAPNNIWTFLCLSPQQKAACKQAFCNSAIGQMVSNTTKPMSFFSGGLVPDCCPAVSLLDLTKPPDSAEGAAARIKQDEADAKKRRAAVRYLGTVDCVHHPEAQDALVLALRKDPNECVRMEAALALGSGCCCSKVTIKALSITLAGTEEDGFPRENCQRVRAAAVGALDHCLACFVEVVPVPPVLEDIGPRGAPPRERLPEAIPAVPAEKLPPATPEGAKTPENKGSGTTSKTAPVAPKGAAYYAALQNVPIKTIVADARIVLERVAHAGLSTNAVAVREHSVTEIVKNAITGPQPAGNAVVSSVEPPHAVVQKPVREKPVREAPPAKPAEFHVFWFNLDQKTTPAKNPAAPAAIPAKSVQAAPDVASATGPKLEDKTITPVTVRTGGEITEKSPKAAPAPFSGYGLATPAASPVPAVHLPATEKRSEPPTPRAVVPLPVVPVPAAPVPATEKRSEPPTPHAVAPLPVVPVPAVPVPAIEKRSEPPTPRAVVPLPAVDPLPVPRFDPLPSPHVDPLPTPRPIATPSSPVNGAAAPANSHPSATLPVAVASSALSTPPRSVVPASSYSTAPAPALLKTEGFTPPRITVQVLLQLLHGNNVSDREWAATELAILRAKDNPNVVQALQEAAQDPEPSVRLAALRAVVAMKAEPYQVYGAAAPLLQDPDARIRTEAYEDLRRIGVIR